MQPLCGFRILELGGFISGPFAGLLLAELGAEIIKIESPDGGDPFRNFDGGGYAPQFCAYNVGKKSVVLDLKDPEGRAEFLRLVSEADAILDNFRPGTMEKLGLGKEVLEAVNPELVHCSITGFGAQGPYRDRPAYDTVATAMSGLLSQFLDPSRPMIAGPAIADPIAGFYAALGLLAALLARSMEKRDRFRSVSVAMLDALVAFNREPFSRFFETGRDQGPYERAAFSQSYAMTCADGRSIALHLSSPQKFWAGLLAAIGRQDLQDNPDFRDRHQRVSNFRSIAQELSATFRERPQAEWLKLLAQHDVPHSPIYALSEVCDDEHARATGVFTELRHPVHGAVRSVAPPIMFDSRRGSHQGPPPALGEHTAELAAAGFGRSREKKVL